MLASARTAPQLSAVFYERLKAIPAALAVTALLLPGLAACRDKPLPTPRHTDSTLEPFLDMNIRLSSEAQAQAREALEGFFARKATPSRIEYTVMAGAPNHTGDWPLLLFVCVHDFAPPPLESASHVAVLTSRIDGHFLAVADLLGGTRVTEPAALNASYPAALRARVQECLKVPSPAQADAS